MNYKIEICANSAASCIEAEKGGAYRVELCAAIPEGGTTPSYGEIFSALKSTSILVNVIIRPRGADFLYSRLEMDSMIKDIEMCKQLGVNGVVIGALDKDGNFNMEYMKELVNAAQGLSITCHRAFDACKDPFVALEQLIELGIDRVLTSGQQANAEKGIPLLKKLVEKADGRIIIMPGCGINENNIKKIAQETGVTELHMSLRSNVEGGMEFRNPDLFMGNPDISEFSYDVTDESKVRRCVNILNDL
ncbi:MAG: copper homeostasis protein CutC [Bacteroidales bacterium]|nr:copper homeostasis protein CutC [Bacteroidales bacterium]